MKLIFNLGIMPIDPGYTGPLAYNRKTKTFDRFASNEIAKLYVKVESAWIPIKTKRL
mgnify:CR=1 FL=1